MYVSRQFKREYFRIGGLIIPEINWCFMWIILFSYSLIVFRVSTVWNFACLLSNLSNEQQQSILLCCLACSRVTSIVCVWMVELTFLETRVFGSDALLCTLFFLIAFRICVVNVSQKVVVLKQNFRGSVLLFYLN